MQQFTAEVRKFGTAPVFFTAISTILGAIMFLRFGFAVGNVGLVGAILLILIGHAVTIPTAMAIAEIATNQKVEGGGEYYIVSRSFGLVIGSSIGIALYLSQAISVAFYIMAFTEAFVPLFQFITERFELPAWLLWLLHQKQTVGIPALLVLTYIMLTRGADLGVKALYVVVVTLALSLVAFFVGTTSYAETASLDPFATAAGNGVGFFTVFAIIFPAFTGMTAGVGLSGDLRDPGKSIPLGTMAATLTGMVIYVFMAIKLASAASPDDLADTSRLIMGEIAWQGWWIIPVGLAAATISSALGSIMVAPRTLQAISRDHILPMPAFNRWLSKGRGKNDEPYNASVITILIAGAFILAGALDSVAQVISMFFMVTYGSLCLISFLNHFAADPSYRPRFRSRWYFSLFGAVACFGLMFFMNSLYALVAIVLMIGLYFAISRLNPGKKSIALIFQGAIFQFSRQLQVFLQKAEKEQSKSWRPSAIVLTENTFERMGAFHLLRWIAHKYGFGTYIHLIRGYLSRQTNHDAKDLQTRLIRMAETSDSNIYIDTLISPSYTSSIAQVIQLPGMAGTDNNLLIFEYSKHKPDNLPDIIDNFKLIKSVDFDIAILRTCERGFGLKHEIHIWITPADFQNATLMILLAYIISGHKDWKGARIGIYAIFPEGRIEEERNRLFMLIETGQLPIALNNIEFISQKPDINPKSIINQRSREADLVILGFFDEALRHQGLGLFEDYEALGNILFLNSGVQKEIK
jgi:amino acid transporter